MSDRRMTFLEAALDVLSEADRPLTSREITTRMLERRLVVTTGKTPEASVAAALYVAVRDGRAPGLQRLYEPGATRARRGSVRWAYRRP
jgi:hypothetical protein